MMNWDGKIVILNKVNMTIYTDTSDIGWGASLDSESTRDSGHQMEGNHNCKIIL